MTARKACRWSPIHAANNETGVIQPIAEIAALVKAAGGVLVVDAVQAAGRIPVDITDGYGDYLILSSHKIGGPKGAGAIVAKSDLMMPAPLVRGGGQEKGHRAGTENLAAIAGFGAAAARGGAATSTVSTRCGRSATGSRQIDRRARARCGDFRHRTAERLANTTFFAIPGIKAETAQIAFDLAGVALSAGSACSSGKVGPSHVLKAMGHGDDAGALRVSIGHSTGDDEIGRFRRRACRDRGAAQPDEGRLSGGAAMARDWCVLGRRLRLDRVKLRPERTI